MGSSQKIWRYSSIAITCRACLRATKIVPSAIQTAVAARPSWYTWYCRIVSPPLCLRGIVLTQYIKAQYQHSTRNGNLSSNRLKKYPLNLLVSGVVTSLVIPQTPTLLFLHLGSCVASSEGELDLDSPSNSSNASTCLDLTISPVSTSSPKSFLRCLDRLRPGEKSRLIQVPQTSNAMTTRGSATAPMPPILRIYSQIGHLWDVTTRRRVHPHVYEDFSIELLKNGPST